MDKVIINFAPTGLIPVKKDTPHVPVTVEEIIADVRSAYEAGITMVHLHARHPDTGEPEYHKEIYAKMIEGIRVFAPDLVICVSTSGRVFNTFETRAEVLQLSGWLKPDMASLTLSSLNFNQKASINEPEMIRALAEEMKQRGIKPELEIFDLGMANYMNYLIRKKMLEPPYYANLILGNIACAQPDLLHIGCIIHDLPKETTISMGGVGNAQLSVNSLAISMGYGVRVGIEDNVWYDGGRSHLATNRELLDRILTIATANDRKVMAPGELRARLGLQPGFGEYGTGS